MRFKEYKHKSKGYTIIESPQRKTYTKGDYVRLGERLRNYNAKIEVPTEDLEILQTLRTSYKAPLSEIFDILQKSVSEIDRSSIVTYRIKRIDSIISKLKRLKDTQLPRIEDIAGCRCILKNNEQVYKLKKILSVELFIKSDRNDYIAEPKEGGYRSLHLIVQTKDKQSSPIEVQLRCEKDHNWATLVEITDLIYGSKIKEFGNDHKLGRILHLLSIGFNNIEESQLNELIDLIIENNFVKKINSVFNSNSIKVRKQWSEIQRISDRNFYLIQVDKENNSHISSYSSFNAAELAYFETFKNNLEHNIVLTYIQNAKFEQISKAYSNYTLTHHNFSQELLSKLQDLVNVSFVGSNIKKFIKYFSLFLDIYFELAKLQISEYYAMQKTSCKNLKKLEWEKDLNKRLNMITEKRHELFRNIKTNKLNIFHWIIKYRNYSGLFDYSIR